MKEHQYNNCVIEYLTVILSYLVGFFTVLSLKIFRVILKSEYKNYCLNFVLDIMNGRQFVISFEKQSENLIKGNLCQTLLTSSMSFTVKKILGEKLFNNTDFTKSNSIEATKNMNILNDISLIGFISFMQVLLVYKLVGNKRR